MESNACAAALLAELSQAKELLKELELNLHCLDLCKALTPRIASSIHNSFLMAESFSTKAGHDQSLFSSLALRPRTLTPRRRMSLLRSWRCQVRLSSVSGGVKGQGEGDGFTWRKYGQKEILGAKYPRAYFRCAHRASHGCPAKKQVQRSDDDPSVHVVTYHGDHTCLEQHDQEQSAAALKVGEEEYFVGQIAPSFGPMEEQFFSSSPYQFGGFHGAESSWLPMEFDRDGEIDPASIWAGVEWMS
ncbi:transcription factor WRKY19-like isoform X1 [Zingiber officinale]|uniref:transcription factor WRKY19-like isoform X1 n=2 Tax=Zingiber officinale TaxID=94328 RepID=UPI001C4AD903|nr:transcription factor WRKY19-like isoform X1 [Zingiber officinale]